MRRRRDRGRPQLGARARPVREGWQRGQRHAEDGKPKLRYQLYHEEKAKGCIAMIST